MKKVITSKRYCPHCLAFCFNCDWTEGANGRKERQRLRYQLHKHIKQTGHKGSIETGIISHYELKDSNHAE